MTTSGDKRVDADSSPPCVSSAAWPTQLVSRKWQTEWEIGKRLATEVEQDETIIHDPVLSAYLNRLEQTIIRKSDLQGCFIVTLIDDVEANAYALPGGFLYVTSGLILVTQTEGELTAALAHETAHVTAHHFVRIEHKRRLWGHLALAGGPPGYLARHLIGPLLTRKLIRNSEFEADRLSLQYQSASGYDPREFSQLLWRVFQDESKPASFIERLFDTHPPTATRIKRINDAGDRVSFKSADYIVDTNNFHVFQERLSRSVKRVNVPSAPKAPK